jgi:hypothetical protein
MHIEEKKIKKINFSNVWLHVTKIVQKNKKNIKIKK